MAIVLLLLALPAQAQTFPKLTGRVVDAANIIPADQEAQLTADLEAFDREKHIQFVVATIPSLEGRPIEDYGYRLGRAWAIGRKEINDGVILIVAPNERKVRIEVGYGLTPVLTAGLSGFIISEKILPRFRDGDMPGGIRAGADEILTQLRLPAPQAEARAKRILAEQEKQSEGGGGDWTILIFWGAVLLFIVLPPLFRRATGRRYRGGSGPVILWGPSSGGSSWGSSASGSSWGGSSGGGFSGGGGSFGGGGASGSW